MAYMVFIVHSMQLLKLSARSDKLMRNGLADDDHRQQKTKCVNNVY